MLGPEERRRKLIGGQHVFSASLGRKVSDASQGGREGAWPRGKMRRSNSFEIGAQHAVGGGDDAEVMDSLKAIATLKNGLCRRFSTVYEAFVFFDMRGDWKVTANELKVMLKQIAIALPDVSQAMRFLDGASQDGAIDAKEFVHMLAWHKVHGDIAHQLELVKPRREVRFGVEGNAFVWRGTLLCGGNCPTGGPGQATLICASETGYCSKGDRSDCGRGNVGRDESCMVQQALRNGAIISELRPPESSFLLLLTLTKLTYSRSRTR